MAAASTYIDQFFSGGVDPTAPHWILVIAAVVGGLAVGGGIVWESHRAGHLWTLPTFVVIVGVVLEAAATVTLLAFDEGISAAQQSKIIVLETEARPRMVDQGALSMALAKFPNTPFVLGFIQDFEANRTEREIRVALQMAHWRELAPAQAVTLDGEGGVRVEYKNLAGAKFSSEELAESAKGKAAAGLVATTLKSIGIEAAIFPIAVTADHRDSSADPFQLVTAFMPLDTVAIIVLVKPNLFREQMIDETLRRNVDGDSMPDNH